MSFSDPDLSGTPTVLNESSAVTFQAQDPPGETDSVEITESVVPASMRNGISLGLGLGFQ